jgi:hypothetical protein
MARTNTTRRFNVKTYTNEEFNRTASKMRSYLYSLARKRAEGTVTADDAHRYMDREGIRPQQVRTRLSFINSVLREPNFEPVDVVASQRPAARGRSITEWTIA